MKPNLDEAIVCVVGLGYAGLPVMNLRDSFKK